MESRKVLSGLCYLSIFFAGFIFPLVVYFVSNDDVTKMHAKKSLLSHLIPLITTPLIILAVVKDATAGDVPFFTIFAVIIFVITILAVTIWNVVKGIKILVAK